MSTEKKTCGDCKHCRTEKDYGDDDIHFCTCRRPACEPQGEIRLSGVLWAEFCECFERKDAK